MRRGRPILVDIALEAEPGGIENFDEIAVNDLLEANSLGGRPGSRTGESDPSLGVVRKRPFEESPVDG